VSLLISRRKFHSQLALAAMGAWAAARAQDDSKDKKAADDKAKPTVYTPGGDVKAPKLTHYVEPQFSASSKEAFVDGVVKISTVVSAEGLPVELKVVSGLNTEADKTAVEAVKQWRFQPGTKSGHPVYVKVTVEVNFHLL
jgi:TonB family protein